jgi:dienelactone hydrolase
MRSGIALLAAGTLLLAGCVELPPSAPAPQVAAKAIPIAVQKPDGPGPFPAIVILHDCSGLGPRSSGAPARWAKTLLAQGYVVAMPDSFSTRGFPGGVCVDPSPARAQVAPRHRVIDADAALAHLRTLPYVDPRRIGVMGGSHGGASTLVTMAQRNDNAFIAGVALYPSCRRWPEPYRSAGPLLILAGELDDWTPAKPCERLSQVARAAGSPVTIKVYAGAHHAFDSANPLRYNESRVNENAPGGRGATTAGNADAWADSIREVTEFFARNVRDHR